MVTAHLKSDDRDAIDAQGRLSFARSLEIQATGQHYKQKHSRCRCARDEPVAHAALEIDTLDGSRVIGRFRGGVCRRSLDRMALA